MSASLSDKERELLYALIERITGAPQFGPDRKEMLAKNVIDLMNQWHLDDFSRLLEKMPESQELYRAFVSSITIHTTSWFREDCHFDDLAKWLEKHFSSKPHRLRVASVACSTGQEVYSIGMILEKFRRSFSGFDYEIVGLDLDELSVEEARRAVYRGSQLGEIPSKYRDLCLVSGEHPSSGWMTLDSEIRRRCRFETGQLLEWIADPEKFASFDVIFCRNVLIYFHQSRVPAIIRALSECVRSGGILVLGQREASLQKISFLKTLGPSFYQVDRPVGSRSRKALVIDDVAPIRTLVSSTLKKRGFQVLEAASAEEASRVLISHEIDFISLDLGLPGEDGVAWLRRLRRSGVATPVVIISGTGPEEAREVYGALDGGADEYFVKEHLTQNLQQLGDMALALSESRSPNLGRDVLVSQGVGQLWARVAAPEVVLIGASTGGPQAIWTLLRDLPKSAPPLVIVQHSSAHFARAFEEKTAERSGLKPGALEKPLERGCFYVSTRDQHLQLARDAEGRIFAALVSKDPVCGHRPSVDVLFNSAAEIGARAGAFLLTGMGDDGARGMRRLYETGLSLNFAQSRDSCAVFGMPHEAIKLGGVHEIGDLEVLRQRLEKLCDI
jgi:two-component system chemotaxis response regulator CheB